MDKAFKTVELYQQNATQFWEQRDFSTAVELYRQGLWEFPDSITLQLGLAYSYFYLKEYASASRCFEIVLRFQPRNKRAQRGMGLCLLKLNRGDDARRVFEQMNLDHEVKPVELMEIAYYFFQVQDYYEALRFSEMVIDRAPKYTDAYICAGGCLHFLGMQPARKMSLFYQALALDGTRADLVDFFGNVLFDDNYFDESMAMFERLSVQELRNPLTLRRVIELYQSREVDESIVNRYQNRLQHLERQNSVDGLMTSIMKFLETE